MRTSAVILLIFLMGLFTGGAAPAVENCDTRRLLNVDRYYGVFATELEVTKLENRHLDIAIASKSPINPITKDPRSLETDQLRDFFEDLVKDPEVIALWPQTVERLINLRSVRLGQAAVGAKADSATGKVLNPKSIHNFKTHSATVSGEVLPDGRHILAHVAGNTHLVLFDVEAKSATQIALPEEAKRSERINLTWYRDNNGELWVYLYLFRFSIWNKMFGLKLGTQNFVDLKFELPRTFEIHELLSPAPGVLIGTRDLAYYKLSTEWPQEIPGMVRGLDKWVFDKSGRSYFAQPYEHGLSSVFLNSTGPVYILANKEGITIDRGDGPKSIPFKPNEWAPEGLSYFELEGREFLAVVYYDGSTDHIVYFWDLAKPQSPINSVKVQGGSLAALHWTKERNGTPILAMTAQTDQKPNLIVLDPFTPEPRLEMDLPGNIHQWIDLRGQTYFSTFASWTGDIFKMFSERGAP